MKNGDFGDFPPVLKGLSKYLALRQIGDFCRMRAGDNHKEFIAQPVDNSSDAALSGGQFSESLQSDLAGGRQ